MKIVLTDNIKLCPVSHFEGILRFDKVLPSNLFSYPFPKDVFALVGGRSLIQKLTSNKEDIFPNCHLVQLLSSGYDNIDPLDLKSRGITVANACHIYDETVAEYAVFMMLKYAKRYHKSLKWSFDRPLRNYHYISELKGKTVGIMGVGNIGSRIAKILSGFDMKIVGFANRTKEKECFNSIYHLDNFGEFLSQSNFIINVLPHTESTIQLLDEEEFSNMKDNVVFVNVGRDSVYSEKALTTFFSKNKDAVAILDRFDMFANPFSKLKRLRNIYITPRIAAYSIESDQALTNLISSNLSEVLLGNQPMNIL